MSQLSLLVAQRKSEDDKEIKRIIKQLQDETITDDRLLRIRANELAYQSRYGKTRASDILSSACSIILKIN